MVGEGPARRRWVPCTQGEPSLGSPCIPDLDLPTSTCRLNQPMVLFLTLRAQSVQVPQQETGIGPHTSHSHSPSHFGLP